MAAAFVIPRWLFEKNMATHYILLYLEVPHYYSHELNLGPHHFEQTLYAQNKALNVAGPHPQPGSSN